MTFEAFEIRTDQYQSRLFCEQVLLVAQDFASP